MSSSKCAKCEQTVYPVEGLRCLDKIWHKGCFKCHECNMTLNMKNYKGFEKQPYCNAHCPQAKATAVADTPEIRRLAENTRIQSQAKYHEDFEKSKGKGFTAIADDPETLRIKNTSKIISNVAYHGELERKKQMEEKRGLSGREDVGNNAIGAITKNNSRMLQTKQEADYMTNQSNNNNNNTGQYQQKQQQPNITQQQKHHHQQQQLIKQQQMQSAQQDQPNNHQVVINQHRQSQQVEGQVQHQPVKQTQQYSVSQQQQQQLIMRQQQQHQMMLQQQQQRQLLESQMSRQPGKQSNNHPQQQHMMKAISGQQHPMKYMPINEAMVNHHHHQSSPSHHMVAGGGGPPHLINPAQMGAISNNQVRMGPNGVIMASNGSAQMSHHLVHGGQYGHGHQINGVMPCKQPQFVGHPPPRHMINPNQQPINHHMMRPPHNHQPILHQQQQQQQAMQQQQVPRRAYRAMYDYVANDVDEVSFIENDILIDCVNVDGNWLIGKVARSGQTGMLPANYVSELSM